MAEVRIPIPASSEIESHTGGTINAYSALLENCYIDFHADGTPYATQRPCMEMVDDASDTVAKTKGRGIFSRSFDRTLWWVNDDTLYQSAYSGGSKGTITTQASGLPVHMNELDDYLTILDYQNAELWTKNGTGSLTKVTDGDFTDEPCQGSVVLNGRLYVGQIGLLAANSPAIIGSDLGDPTAWDPLNTIAPQRESDQLLRIEKQGDHVVAFGSKTIEFFRDTGNATGSQLSVRTDLSYNVGLAGYDQAANTGDAIYFIGVGWNSGIGVYELANHRLKKISPPWLDAYLLDHNEAVGSTIVISVFTLYGKQFVMLETDASPVPHFCFDGTGWFNWAWSPAATNNIKGVSTDVNQLDEREPMFIWSNGDIFKMTDRDRLADDQGGGDNYIDMVVQFPQWDGGTMKEKNENWVLPVISLRGSNSYANATLDVADGQNTTFSGGYTVNLKDFQYTSPSDDFRRRAHKLTITANHADAKPVQLEGLQADIT